MSRSRRRIPRSLSITLALLGVAALVYATHAATLWLAAPQLTAAKARIKTQRAEIRALTSRLESSKDRLQVAQQEASVMRQANQMLREGESERQAEFNRLQTELDFYRRLAGTSGAQTGLAIYRMELSATGSDRVFRFVLTLTQNLRRSAIVSGKARIDLEGTMGDRLLSLPWSEITDGSRPEPQFRFKYFQQLDGYLALPQQFSPSRLLVSLEVKGQEKLVTRSFDWAEITAVPAQEPGKPGSGENTGPEKEPARPAPD